MHGTLQGDVKSGLMPDGTLRLIHNPVFLPLTGAARYKGAFGGRGSGKSHFFAEQMLSQAVTTPGFRGVCIREVQKDLKTSSKQLIEDKIYKFGLGKHVQVQESEIRTLLDGHIIFKGMQNYTADSIKSLEGYQRLWGEEAQALSQRSLDLLRPTIRAPQSELWFSWNPENGPNSGVEWDPIDKFFRGGEPPPNSACVEANYWDNQWFPSELQDEMEYDRRRDPDKYAWIWLGHYRKLSEARVFQNWEIAEFDTPNDVEFYHGADWGYSIDPTVLVRCFIVGRKLYVDQEVYKVGCDIDRTPELFEQIPTSKRWPIVADNARPETIAYMRARQFNIKPSIKGKGSVEDGIEFLRSYDIVVHPRCRHTTDEMTLYSWKVDARTGEILPVLDDKHNHVIDALRYAVEGVRRKGVSMVDYL